jgi:hypothetical protein
MLEAASLFDPVVQVTRAEDLGQDTGGLAPENSARNGNTALLTAVSASTGSSSSGLSPSSSTRTFNTTPKNKLPNIKFFEQTLQYYLKKVRPFFHDIVRSSSFTFQNRSESQPIYCI